MLLKQQQKKTTLPSFKPAEVSFSPSRGYNLFYSRAVPRLSVFLRLQQEAFYISMDSHFLYLLMPPGRASCPLHLYKCHLKLAFLKLIEKACSALEVYTNFSVAGWNLVAIRTEL